MMNKRNLVTLEGGLTKDATLGADGKIVELSLGVDGSGSEKGVANASGYFDVKVWLTESKYSPAALGEDVQKYLDEGSLVKGARVGVVGRLVQERWKNQEGKTSSRIVVMAEGIDVWRKAGTGAASAGTVQQAASASASSSIDDF